METVYPQGFVPPDVACFGKRYVRRWQATSQQLRTYAYWRQLFYTAAVSRFKWDGLPDQIDQRFIEQTLCGWGSVALTKRADSPVAPWWAARMTPMNRFDIYNNPNEIMLIAPNGYQQRRHANYWIDRDEGESRVMPPDAAICWDNLTRLPTLQLLDLQAKRLAEMDATVDQHSRALRVPVILAVDEESKKNAEAIFNQINGANPVLYMSPAGAAIPVQALQLLGKQDYAGSDLLNDMLKIVAQVYTLLGIDNNAAAEKKERVQTSETLANNEQIMIQRNSFLNARKQFCDQARKLWGWEVKVTWSVPHTAELDQNSYPVSPGFSAEDEQGESVGR